MKIAFIHYHLKPGGVTTVLRQQVDALKNDGRHLVLVGEPPPAEVDMDVVIIDGLGYDSHRDTTAVSPQQVADEIMGAITAKFGGPCDLIHVHNPTLVKNRNLLTVLGILQKQAPLLLQIHDFAEDGRPAAFTRQDYIADCHYAVINRRDHRLLSEAGLESDGLHILPNSVAPPSAAPSTPAIDNYVLYPIRAIRRKNIGEAILLSCFFKRGEVLAITLPPNSPADMPGYRDWKVFAAKQGLSATFDVGVKHDFQALMSNARYILTTSITEGFGFAFLEPWLAGKVLWGRLLPEICSDFEEAGIALTHLYHTLKVPSRWVNLEAFREERFECIRQNCRRYEYSLSPALIDSADQELMNSETIDFGLLNEAFQKEIISRVANRHRDAADFGDLNPFLQNLGHRFDSAGLIESNRIQVLAHYNDRRYRQRLLNTYHRVAHTPVRHRIDKQRLLSYFMQLDRFSLLKWCRYAG